MKDNKIIRDFPLTVFSLKNRTTIFVAFFILAVLGMYSYVSLPKEMFPEINYPTVFVQTIYLGNSPEDMENLVTKPLEKQLKTLKGLKQLKSTSVQDVSMVFVEFTPDTKVKDVLQDVKDAVDKAKSDLPTDLLTDPNVIEFDMSSFPVININLSGDFGNEELKEYAEYLQDEIETVPEVSRVDIKGLNDREIQIMLDMHSLDAYNLSFASIEQAVASENLTISAGEIKMGDFRRSIRIAGEFESLEDIRNLIVKSEAGKVVYLKDIAEVVDGYAEPKNFARLGNQAVVSLQVVKKSGENLLSAIEQTLALVEKAKTDKAIPKDLTITLTNDQSVIIKNQLTELENTLLIGIFLVIVVLLLFIGTRNALIVGIAIPVSMLLTFVVLKAMGASVNMMVLFSLILAVGMVVDDAIVVVENIYRFVNLGYSKIQAARLATGEIAIAVISSTVTTLAAFFPLLFWTDIIGEFMKFLPITLIVSLSSSLLVALTLNPVISSYLVIKPEEEKRPNKKKNIIAIIVFVAFALIFYIGGNMLMGNLSALAAILGALNAFVLYDLSRWFQDKVFDKIENGYSKLISFTLRGKNPTYSIIIIIFLLFFSIAFMFVRKPNVVLFPNSAPQYINIIAELPIGTDITATDSIVKIIEADVFTKLEKHKDIVESILTTVGEGVARQNSMSIGNTANKGLITIKFVDYKFRGGVDTKEIMKDFTIYLNNRYPGVTVYIEKNSMGPPTGAPINIEIKGEEMEQLIALSDTITNKIINSKIEGVEKLKIDIETGKPELNLIIDRDKARRFGLSTYQIAMAVRTALFGKDISNFKDGDDEYNIQLRFNNKDRYSLSDILNEKISFRNMMGMFLEIPISAVADVEFTSSFGTIKRVDQERTITLFSNVVEGYNPNEIIKQIQTELKNYQMPEGYSFTFTGEQEKQKESMSFLMLAMLGGMFLIILILVTEFNSVIKSLIVMTSVVFSTIGVFLGIGLFKLDFVIIMTGIGIVALAGIVVKNAIVLIDYTDHLKSLKKEEMELDEDDNLPLSEIITILAKAGKTRLRPVLLTALCTILGLLPMGVGMNIHVTQMFTELRPDIYFGGDNVMLWQNLSLTIIFGLTFSTFLTLVIVPAIYLVGNKSKINSDERRKKRKESKL